MTTRTDAHERRRQAAVDGLHLLQLAHERWKATQRELGSPELTADNRREFTLRLYGDAINVLVWARGLDKFCKGKNSPVSGYAAARPAMAAMLDGGRFACEHAIHQLGVTAQAVSGLVGPLIGPLTSGSRVRWAAAELLPNDERGARGRVGYEQTLANRDIAPTLDQLVGWFERQIGAVADGS